MLSCYSCLMHTRKLGASTISSCPCKLSHWQQLCECHADNDKLVAGLLQQAQLLTTLSAFLSGCKSGLTGRQAHVHVSRSRVQTSRESLATAADTSTSTAIANDQDSALDKSRKDGTESSTAPSTEASEGKFWKPLTVSLRSIARSASKVQPFEQC